MPFSGGSQTEAHGAGRGKTCEAGVIRTASGSTESRPTTVDLLQKVGWEL